MKRLALLSVVALMLASAVFAPVAMAQEPGDVDITSVTLGPAGSLHVEGTIICLQGHQYEIFLEARQTQGNQPSRIGGGGTGTLFCNFSGLQPFSVDVFPNQGSKPFRKGEVVLSKFRFLCGPSLCVSGSNGFEVFEVR
ncbi:MAG TPA: hypothetical protein VKA82_19615 [Rubrobacter sp.]|nr:hypothetical protein [Rubrobacter sp.]